MLQGLFCLVVLEGSGKIGLSLYIRRCCKDCSVCLHLKKLEGLFRLSVTEDGGGIVLSMYT